MMFYVIKDKPITALYSLATIAVGAVVFLLNNKKSLNNFQNE
jgi:hypothetical protein